MRVIRWAPTAVLGMFLAACVTEATAPPPTTTANADEASAIATAQGAVRRDGGRLILSLSNGGTMEFADYRGKPQGGTDWDAVSHVYRGRLGGGRYHLFTRSAYGRSHGVLVESGSGASWSVPAVAVIGSGGDRLLILPDEAGGKRLQIWYLGGARPKVELDVAPGRPVRFDSWTGDRIALRVPDQGVMKALVLEQSWGAWSVPAELKR